MSALAQMFCFVDINPEPWAIGTASAGRRAGQIKGTMSPNQKLVAYKSALREEVEHVLRDKQLTMFEGPMRIRFWFWRQIEVGHAGVTRKKQSGHDADATNLQKSTEDALQGLLFFNDRETRDIRSEIVDQGENVRPCIVVRIEPYQPLQDPESVLAFEAVDFEIARVNAPSRRAADAPDISPWS